MSEVPSNKEPERIDADQVGLHQLSAYMMREHYTNSMQTTFRNWHAAGMPDLHPMIQGILTGHPTVEMKVGITCLTPSCGQIVGEIRTDGITPELQYFYKHKNQGMCPKCAALMKLTK